MYLSNLFQSLFISNWPSSLRSCPAVQKGTFVNVGNRKEGEKNVSVLQLDLQIHFCFSTPDVQVRGKGTEQEGILGVPWRKALKGLAPCWC